ncbi:MAG: phosphatidate cytidylyltransferase [Betaproteobacteria bacterium]|nr:phosphatidate cytidylyltransferase [Betaproteobacteria bacterium]
MLKRTAVALPLLAAVLALVWRGDSWMWATATFFAALLAAREWGRLGGLGGRAQIAYVAFSAALMLGGKFLLDGNLAASDALFSGACFFWAAAAPFAMLSGVRFRPAIFCAAGMLVIFSAWYAAVLLFANDLYVLLGIMSLVWAADTAAFLGGRRWGKTKMAPLISPGKTWEGFFCGMAAALLLAHWGGAELFSAPPPVWLWTAGFAVASLAALGDLFESSLKRQCGVKDSGILLGAHGGVLDRLDALLPVLPFGALISPWLI